MKTTIQILSLVIALLFSSCNINIKLDQVSGNGEVVTQEREVTADFYLIKGSTGLDVYLTEGDTPKIVVEADENLHEFIETRIEDGKLHIKATKNIRRASARKVYVTYTSLEGVEASSGADIKATSQIKAENLTLKSSSGADLEADVYARELSVTTSSGARIKLSGSAKNSSLKASSGSDIKASDLETLTCEAQASSGADITIKVLNTLEGKASSGGIIKYYGDPSEVASSKSTSGGSIKKMD
jgi:hypothetical protein